MRDFLFFLGDSIIQKKEKITKSTISYIQLQKLLRLQHQERDDHFLQGNAAMLESISVVAHIVVIIIGVGKEQIVLGKNKGTAHIDTG